MGILLLAGSAPLALAQISSSGATYRCVDGTGRSTYTNVKEEMDGKKCTVVSREVSVVPAQQPTPAARPPATKSTTTKPATTKSESTPAAASPERVAPGTQRARDNDRRRILEDELRNAEKSLATAKENLAQQESIRTGDERNYQRVLDRLKPYQDEVRRAEDNEAALKREISNLR